MGSPLTTVITAALLGVAALADAALAQAEAPAQAAGFKLTTARVASGLSKPVWAGSPPGDDRLFTIEQESGKVLIIVGGQPQSPPYLDLSTKIVKDAYEQGLLGLAFDPGFQSNGFFYVNYTRKIDGATMVVRYHALNANAADPASAVTILGPIAQPQLNHNGGNIRFGPDGKLYVGMGDGGGALDLGVGHAPGGNGQSGTTLLGKILRLNADGSTPADNPFKSPTDGFLDQIWDYGLRNPWRWSFDRLTGDLWLADVGENLHEELNFQKAGTAGRNFGWHCMESFECTTLDGCTCNAPTLTKPVYQYGHEDNKCAIIGGHVYRGPSIPQLNGTYFFGDFCTGRIWSCTWDGAHVANLLERTAELQPGFGQSIDTISSFGEDRNGELLIVDHDGEIYRVVPVVSDPPDPPENAFTNLGGGLPGTKGIPLLVGQGNMTPASANQITLTKANTFAQAFLAVSLVGEGAPFKGGTLKATPIIILIPFTVPLSGSIVLPLAGPQSAASGMTLYFQFAIEDHHAKKHVALSTALKAAIP